jgi:hypothetical protein
MATWDELKVVLSGLSEIPGVLTGYPDPRSDRDRLPPFRIKLAAWATDEAADLHDRFERDVELIVGALDYPSCTYSGRRTSPDAPILDVAEMSVDLEGSLTVTSGHTAHHGLLLSNHGGEVVQVVTNRQVTATVVDPETGRRVGGFAGAQRLPRQVFRVAPATTERIPLLVGTASFVPDLGYAVPPGEWAFRVTLNLVDRSPRRTPSLPFTIV